MEENKIEMNTRKENKKLGKKEQKKLAINIVALLLMIVVGILIANFHGFPWEEKEKDEVDFSGVSRICELSTLRCYYHNVAELKRDPDKIYEKGWFKYGYKKVWLEYTGTIEVGIDVDQVQMNDPDENNVVYVYVPDAKIMNVNADTSTMSEPIVDTGYFTEVTAEDQEEAFSAAQKNMENKAKEDVSLLNRAKSNAKKLIEQYIINVGNQIGENYKVKWLDKPKTTKGDVKE